MGSNSRGIKSQHPRPSCFPRHPASTHSTTCHHQLHRWHTLQLSFLLWARVWCLSSAMHTLVLE